MSHSALCERLRQPLKEIRIITNDLTIEACKLPGAVRVEEEWPPTNIMSANADWFPGWQITDAIAQSLEEKNEDLLFEDAHE